MTRPPRWDEMVATIVSLVPFEHDQRIRCVELGSGGGDLAAAFLDAFPSATMLALDDSEEKRQATAAATAHFGERIAVAAYTPSTLGWWDRMYGADLVIASLCLHEITDAKKQYLYKAIAERLSATGAFLAADVIQPLHSASRRLAADASGLLGAGREAPNPSPLFHHLVWLKHAGFPAVECFWMMGGYAVFGGFKESKD
jgi:tRNA (cmo5U34)-methyltransferase